MAIAFLAGMIITAALAQTPAATDIFSPKSSHEPVRPVLPDTMDSLMPGSKTDTAGPVRPRIIELVYTLTGEVVAPC